MAEKKYKKLSGYTSMSSQRSFLGDDHLLVLDGRYKEISKRLFYSDIEAILITPTNVGKVTGLFGGLLGLMFLIITLVNWEGGGGSWFLAFISSFFWLIFAYSVYSKGSVFFGVQTAVQTIVLDGINTYRKAQKAEQKLAERIEAIQGQLTEEVLQAALDKQAKANQGTGRSQYWPEDVPPPMSAVPPQIPQSDESGATA